MADKNGSGTPKRYGHKPGSLKYFFLDGELHKILHISRPQDLILAWHYTEGRRKAYIWSDVQRNMQKSYLIGEAAKMLERSAFQIKKQWKWFDNIKPPPRSYTLDGNKSPGYYRLSEDYVLELHDLFTTRHRGRARLDGMITPQKIPTRAELIAMMRHDMILYIKTAEGDFAPAWKESAW